MSNKEIKRAYKCARRASIGGWKIVSVIFIILTIILAVVAVFLNLFDNTIAAYTGGSFWKLENSDPSAIYYSMDFDSVEELEAYGRDVCRMVEAEGAVLLLNENEALPLASGAKVSCFSTSSVNLVYGGTGSGNIDASKADHLDGALQKAGLEVNPLLWSFYTSGEGSKYLRKGGTGVLPSVGKVSEAPWNTYTQDVLNSVSDYGDAAIIVLSRIGGEGYDMEFAGTNYLTLDQNERDMLAGIKELKQTGAVKKTVVLLNTANALQMDFLKGNPYDIDAVLWIGDVGITGINAVADILTGVVNPSGSLADTYCYDNFSSPAMANFVPTTYAGYAKQIPANASTYMIYQEGIYVGYKYYETRYEDFVMGTGNAGEYAYQEAVAFPFGYGLSYSSFAYSDLKGAYHPENDSFEITVTVTNTGKAAGKHTVQIYSQSPYTDYDREHGVEKASAALCGFAKTNVLQPGEAQTVTVTVEKRELASFDAYGAGTYILDEGQYSLTAASNVHQAVNNFLANKGYTKSNTDGRMDADGDVSMVFAWNQEVFDQLTYSVSKTGTPIVNQLSDADLNLNDGVQEKITWLSRNDWAGTYPREILQLTLTERLTADLQDIQYKPENYTPVSMPVLGAKNGLRLFDLIGKEYDDPLWEQLLDQMTFDEMVALIGDSFHWRMPVKSIEAPGSRDENGPQGLTASLFGSGSTKLDATAFTSEDLMAATFNTELTHEIGRIIGNDCISAGISCLYGPGNNLHRTPYGGRNFEYYSEDGFLSGMISAYEVKGIQEKGVDVMMKHFALNDCEQDRIGLGVWINEQAARENYLKPFQLPFEFGNATGIMAAYTRWGCTWSGGHKGLMTGILRNEWGANGMSITDNVLTTYVNGVDGIMAGISTYDAMLPFVLNQLPKYKNDPVIVTAMRQACHRNLYSLANSCGVNGLGADTTIRLTRPTLIPMATVAAIISAILCALFVSMWIKGIKRLKKTEAFAAYRAAKKARSST